MSEILRRLSMAQTRLQQAIWDVELKRLDAVRNKIAATMHDLRQADELLGDPPDLPFPIDPEGIREPKGVAFDKEVRTDAEGSDNHALTWLDDRMLCCWGDGWGFENLTHKRSIGFSEIRGTPDNPTFKDGLYTGDGKCYGPLAVKHPDGQVRVWAFIGKGSGFTSCTGQALWRSNDEGKTFHPMPFQFNHDTHRVCLPSLVQCGPNYEWIGQTKMNPDYVYALASTVTNKEWTGWGGNSILLWRGHIRDGLWDGSNWSYWAGAHWATSPEMARPVLRTPGGSGMVSCCWVPYLKQWVLITEWGEKQSGNSIWFHATRLWGPWKEFYRTSHFGREQGLAANTFYWNLAPMWLDGEKFVLVATGIGSNDRYIQMSGRWA